MRLVQLSGKKGLGKYTIIDDEDYDEVVKTKWSLSYWPDGRFYVCGWRNKKHSKLHRFVTGAPPGQYVDHVNGDTLDNRKENLRFCTNQQNQYNSRKTLGKNLPKGVYKTHNKSKPYKAIIMVNRKNIHIGYFSTPEEAHIAYAFRLQQVAGEYARH